jgi:hypothetical protein
MDDEALVYSQVYWEDMVYSEDGDVKSFGRSGYVLAMDRCTVTGIWHLLIAGHDGRLYSLTHDNPTLVYMHGEDE